MLWCDVCVSDKLKDKIWWIVGAWLYCACVCAFSRFFVIQIVHVENVVFLNPLPKLSHTHCYWSSRQSSISIIIALPSHDHYSMFTIIIPIIIICPSQRRLHSLSTWVSSPKSFLKPDRQSVDNHRVCGCHRQRLVPSVVSHSGES